MRKLISFLITVIIFTTGLFALQWKSKQNVYEEMPYSYWAEYSSVTPYKEVFDVNETLRFVSERIVYREVGVDWNDVLYCDNDNDGIFGFKASYESSSRLLAEGHLVTNPWFYKSGEPGFETNCYLKSEISYIIPILDSPKIQIVTSPIFKVRNLQ